ncbi:MAG: signal recognition particle-docking protein FtsY [Desulfovibrionaceae bacterium]|nr:signal recognition particle-docking protein FtsY [Desulfovibrionaceae bacterium]
MGFFSSIKKFFGSEPSPKEDSTAPQAAQEAEAQPCPPQEAANETLKEEAQEHDSSTEDTAQTQAEVEVQAQGEAEAAAKAEAVRALEVAKQEAQAQAQAQAEAQAQAAAQQKAQEQAQRLAQEQQAQAEAEAKALQEQETARKAAEAQAQTQAEAEAQAQAAAQQKAQEQAQRLAQVQQAQAEAEAKALQAQEAARKAAEAQAQAAAEAEANLVAQAQPALSGADDADSAMTLRLRSAEPRLSAWLAIILEGVSEADELLWQRLRFLLRALDAPADEAERFVQDFQAWLERMEYRWLEEFRSELQYRLALALDLEDEEDERSRLFIKLTEGLSRTREQFSKQMDALFSGHSALNDQFWEEMEELFIMADLGYEPALALVNDLKERARKANVTDPHAVRGLLHEAVQDIFKAPRRIKAINKPEVILMIGVNGVGKTTTIAKLAHRERMQGKKVLIAAADTFRAAAVEQLKVWADRVGADFHSKPTGADPAAVAFEAMDIAVRDGYDVLFVDTAGRLQTKVNLMEELTKIRTVLGKKHQGAPHRSILVIDATTGQNALSQTKLFKEAAGIDELILTKLDGTAKGGVAIAVAMQNKIPITYVGLGEKLEDLRPFNGKDYALALLGEKQQ